MKKWSGRQANSKRLSVENFDGENVDKFIKIKNLSIISPIKILRHAVFT